MNGDINMKNVKSHEHISLYKWIWKSYIHTALIPLLIIELTFILAYFSLNIEFQQKTTSFFKEQVQNQLEHIVTSEANLINLQLSSMANSTLLFSNQMENALSPPASLTSTDYNTLNPTDNDLITSTFYPVYTHNSLDGFTGINITINTITNQILSMNIPWHGYALLMSSDGSILALPNSDKNKWALDELSVNDYRQSILNNNSSSDQFNLYRNNYLSSLKNEINNSVTGFSNFTFKGEPRVISWSTISNTGWKLLIIVPEQNIYAKINTLKNNLIQISIFIVSGLVLSYLVFYLIFLRKAQKMTATTSNSLLEINDIVQRISHGEYTPETPELNINELNDLSMHLSKMGKDLGETNKNLLITESELIKMERDIADQKEMAKSLITAKEEAEKANKAKSEFLSNMSHELRTPLNAILGFSQILELDPESPLTDSQHESVKEILKAGNHLLELINEVLDLSKIESGNLIISIESVPIKSVMDETFSIIKPFADKNNIKIITYPTEDLNEFVLADHTRLKQILLNLLTNAVKYNKENGEVTFYHEKINNKLRFHVIDTGIGLSSCDLDIIFKPFHRLNKINNKIEGTGIGLAVAKQLVELMDGKIYVDSEKDIGSDFFVEFPCVDAHILQDSEISISTENQSSLSKNKLYTVLYVEDNPANLRLVERILMQINNIEMLSATSGELSIDLAIAHKPNIILLDINLPGINGYEVFKRLKLCDETNNIPVVAISAHAMPKDIAKCLNYGFIDYITKPINVQRFTETISNILAHNESKT
jgi:signal transduction histidine kinase/CheY-like chemotaxis protein